MFKTPRRISADTIPSLCPLRKFIFLYGNIAISSVAGDMLGSWDAIVGVVLGSCPEDCGFATIYIPSSSLRTHTGSHILLYPATPRRPV